MLVEVANLVGKFIFLDDQILISGDERMVSMLVEFNLSIFYLQN